MKNYIYIIFLLVSCKNDKYENQTFPSHKMDFDCKNLFYAKDDELEMVAFEITFSNNDTLMLNDNKYNITDPAFEQDENGFYLINLYTGDKKKLFDLVKSDSIFISPGKSKYYLYSTSIHDWERKSFQNDRGWFIKYEGQLIYKNGNNSTKIESNNIYIPINDIETNIVSSEGMLSLVTKK